MRADQSPVPSPSPGVCLRLRLLPAPAIDKDALPRSQLARSAAHTATHSPHAPPCGSSGSALFLFFIGIGIGRAFCVSRGIFWSTCVPFAQEPPPPAPQGLGPLGISLAVWGGSGGLFVLPPRASRPAPCVHGHIYLCPSVHGTSCMGRVWPGWDLGRLCCSVSGSRLRLRRPYPTVPSVHLEHGAPASNSNQWWCRCVRANLCCTDLPATCLHSTARVYKASTEAYPKEAGGVNPMGASMLLASA
jgi:hypothetical protein